MKRISFIVLKKNRIFSMVFLLVFLALCIACVSLSGAEAVYFGRTARKVPIYRVDRQDKKIALTFDAAWGADKTRQIVDILKQKNCGGTFFLVGFWVEKYPDEVRYIDQNGLDIGTHSSTHPHMSKLDAAKINLELKSSMDKIISITKKPVRFFRPPFGDYNDTLIECAQGLNLKTIQWSIDSLDWKDLTPDNMLARVKKGLQKEGGDIVLFHNNSKYVVESLPMIIDHLLSNNYKIVNLSELVYENDYVINSEGIQLRK